MNMLIETLGEVGNHWLTWLGVGLVAFVGLCQVWYWRRCPYLNCRKQISREEAEARLRHPFMAGTRFFVVMLAGVGAILAGMALIANDVRPVLSFLLVIAGVYVVQSEPARLRLRESIDRVAAAEALDQEAMDLARERLRDSHLWTICINFMLTIAFAAGLLAF